MKYIAVLMAVCCLGSGVLGQERRTDIYVPYEDLARLIEPADKAVLMDRAEFEALLAAAEANARESGTIELGQVLEGKYRAEVEADKLTLTGTLEVVSLGKGPVAVPLAFGQVGLTQVLLDGKDAPLGYDRQGRLTLIVASKGKHRLDVTGTTRLKELSTGGMQFGLSLPAAVACTMTLSAPGDLEIHASVPVSQLHYDKQADRTSAELTLGGQDRLTAVLLGNGRQQDEDAILLGESATTVHLTRSHQQLRCLYMLQVLRRGVREVQFQLPSEWTITEVACPNLVRWSIDTAEAPGGLQTLTVRLRSEKMGATAIVIKASAPRDDKTWRAPRVSLAVAAYERGYTLVNTDEQLSVRAEQLTDARREDVRAIASVAGAVSPSPLGDAAAGRLYFHWGDKWSVQLELAPVEPRRSIKERQTVSVSPQRVTLVGNFEVTAIGRELFEMSFVLGDAAGQWQIKTVQIDKQITGFEYRVEQSSPASPNGRLLAIELPAPIRPEKVANVTIELEHVPSDWYWPTDAAGRSISVPLIHHQASLGGESQAPTVSGEVLISAIDDLDALPQDVPEELSAVPVGRMALLGIERSVQYAYSYNVPVTDQIQLQVSRRRPRISADAVGLVTVGPREFSSDWRITYAISRASTRRLYLLADKSLGWEIKIASPTVPISSKNIVTPDANTVSLSTELSQRYDLWLLDLDHKALGEIVVDVRYERPKTSDDFEIPLVRPIWEQFGDANAPAQGQTSEQLALQASEELALTISSTGAKEIDAVDLPALPAEAARVVAAFRLDAPTTPAGSAAAIRARTAVHKGYEIPSALAISAELTTYLGVQGGQRTQAQVNIANAGRQFLTIRLPDGAQLWSLRVADEQAKPQQGAGGDYQVALGPLGKPVDVKIVYAYEPGESDLERVKLGGVELPGVEINQMNWTVIPPPGYFVSTQETKMQTSGVIKPAPVCVHICNALFKSIFPLRPRIYHGRAFSTSVLSVEDHASAETGMMEPVEKSGRAGGYGGGMGGYGGGAAPPPTARSLQTGAEPASAKPTETKPMAQKAHEVRAAQEGRFTLPVDLVPTPGAGPQVRFTGLGAAELVVGLTSRSRQLGGWTLGFILITAAGVALARKPARVKATLIIAVLFVSSLSAVWLPATTSFANGAFTAGLFLMLLYALTWLARGIWGLSFRTGLATAATSQASVTIATSLMLLALTAGSARGVQNRSDSEGRQDASTENPPAVIPYAGNPAAAEQADKILVPYAHFVELWNQAHPDDRIDWPAGETQISLADVQYKVTIGAEQLELLLTAEIETHGAGWGVLGLPFSSLAVTQATFNGKPAQLQAGPKGMVLMLPGETTAPLELHAVAKPEYLGRRGSAAFTLPPLPAAVMTVALPDADLELEVGEIETIPEKRIVNGAVEYSFGLGMVRELALRWLPKMAAGTVDRTLSANAQHEVYIFHWAMVAVSKLTYSFSSGQYDRFALLIPQGATLTELEGTNVRDFRDVGEQTSDGSSFRLIEVRLHRPAQKQYEMTVRWLSPLARGASRPRADDAGLDTGQPTELSLPRAGAVSRESGTVTLSAAGGMNVKVTGVTGGRRVNLPDSANRLPEQAGADGSSADRAEAIAAYYWPYRPFALYVELSRLAVTPKVHLDQLVRIDTDRVELLVQAVLKTEQGKLFGAAFSLPAGYELLSAVGPAVANFYERSDEEGRFLHVMFHRGQTETQIALMLVRKDAPLDSFEVPAVMYLSRQALAPARQQGRIAVQVAASLEAQTAASQNVKSVSPAALRDWLDEKTVNAVQFAYRYEAAPSLGLTIRHLPTTLRAEIFAGLVVRTTAADYTYRLRYNITGSPVDHLSFRLPNEYARLVNIESQAMRSVTQTDAGNGLTQWTVALVNEVTGIVDIVVNFALPIDPSTGALAIAPLGVETAAEYRAVVAIQNVSRHEITVKDSTNLSDLPASEQQKLMPPWMRESLQYVLQSFDQDWLLNLDLTQRQAATRIQAVVDLLEITTVIDRSGRCRYEAKVALQNRSEQFLRVRIPRGLRLWSASVAGQPVKPVMAEDSPGPGPGGAGPEADVLIPLVKTSPGGLPYDVYFYLADDQAGPLVTPLNGLTKLEPPGLSIVGIPVTQTTWSLRLPGGHRYMRPGGNMSPVAGTVEVLSLGIEAKLEQLKRLERTYRDVAGSSSRTEQIARSNWEKFNKRLSADIGQAQSYLASGRGQVNEQDYNRLKTKLEGQRQQQAGLLGSNTLFVQKQQEQARQDLNAFLNVDASNAGVAEIIRNQVLLEKPEFLTRNEEQQIARLQQELAASQEQLELLGHQREGFAGAEKALKQDAATTAGPRAEELIAKLGDKELQMGRTLDELARETAAQIDQKQAQIKEQLEELKDNRLARHFQAGSGKMVAPPAPTQPQSRQGSLLPGDRPSRAAAGRPQAGQAVAADQYSVQYEYDIGGRVSSSARQREGQVSMAGPGLPAQAEEARGQALAVAAYGPQSAVADMQPYTARGTYSLPVTLPQGEVRLDFARPSGEAQLTLWAVPLGTIRKLYGTAGILAALFAVLVLAKKWPRPQSRRPASAKRIIGYGLLSVALSLVAGLLGLLVSLLVIALCEAKRGAFVPSEPGPPPGGPHAASSHNLSQN